MKIITIINLALAIICVAIGAITMNLAAMLGWLIAGLYIFDKLLSLKK